MKLYDNRKWYYRWAAFMWLSFWGMVVVLIIVFKLYNNAQCFKACRCMGHKHGISKMVFTSRLICQCWGHFPKSPVEFILR
jgi:hypothetical protein